MRPDGKLVSKERRVALVIGNASYESSALKNPVNDARDLAAALESLGFSVNRLENAGLQVMENAIRDFGNNLTKGGIGFFYYSGHGMQVNGHNYLIPVGVTIHEEKDVKYNVVDVNEVLKVMAGASNQKNVVVLDTSRHNPFARSVGSADVGLARMEAPSGTLISYATSPDSVAADGEGRNSPYTGALLKYITKPGLTIEKLFRKVREEVYRYSGGRQISWESSSLTGEDFYLVPSERVGDASSDAVKTPVAISAPTSTPTPTPQPPTPVLRPGKNQDDQGKTGLINNGNGTVTDQRTGLIWLQNANCFGQRDWITASEAAKTLSGGRCGLTDGSVAGDWRLPSKDELNSLIYPGQNPALPADHPFIGVQLGYYWSSTTNANDTSVAWVVFLNHGFPGWIFKTYTIYVWPVRGGK
ncbi:MAG: caspase family protein [Deltaproteobacteria bacterium]|nr:caspase family protein [Deltaproteobacteria bacterium]